MPDHLLNAVDRGVYISDNLSFLIWANPPRPRTHAETIPGTFGGVRREFLPVHGLQRA